MANKVVAVGIAGAGVFTIVGSLTGNLSPMLAALFDPKDLTARTNSSTTKSSSSNSTYQIAPKGGSIYPIVNLFRNFHLRL
jgi:hypothetical protein